MLDILDSNIVKIHYIDDKTIATIYTDCEKTLDESSIPAPYFYAWSVDDNETAKYDFSGIAFAGAQSDLENQEAKSYFDSNKDAVSSRNIYGANYYNKKVIVVIKEERKSPGSIEITTF
jgi:hypothetical protein